MKRLVALTLVLSALLLLFVVFGGLFIKPSNAQYTSTAATRYLTVAFASLGTPANGSVRYCSNCQATSPCTSGGSGAVASRVNGAWNCATGGTPTSTTINSTDGRAPYRSSSSAFADSPIAASVPGSMVNYLTVTGGATGNGVSLAASGSDSNINFTLSGKGTGRVLVNGVKVYRALLSQTGTDDPVATVLENSLGGTVVWTRDMAGVYFGTLSNAFTADKTFAFVGSVKPDSTTALIFTSISRADASGVVVDVRRANIDTPTLAGSDDWLAGTPVEILVYP